ncbi:MAG: antitoxin [Actinomyces sp.]|nr:antitoxin [Actinomyces sp.]MDN6428420.1 antitoxin [Propionibacterium sp.]
MDLDGIKKTAEGLKLKAEDLVGSTLKDESKTDSALDAVAGAAKKATGGKFDAKIDSARTAADQKLGSE